MGRLSGKAIVVTGAGSGIGEGVARAFVAEGASVGLLDRDAQAVERIAAEVGVAAYPLDADVADERSVERAFAEVRHRHKRLDVLATFAAVQLVGEDAPAHELDLDVWHRTVAVNLTGVFLCCKHGLRLMVEAENGGSVINCGSPTGLTMCGAGFTAYSTSKGGVMSMTRVLAADYAKHNIRVNGIVPGTIRTPLTAKLIDDPATYDALVKGEPIGRIGTPDDVTGVAVFLASDESSFATGAHFHVDGGISVR